MKNLRTRTGREEKRKKNEICRILLHILTWIGYYMALPVLISWLQKFFYVISEIFAFLYDFLTLINSYLIYKLEKFMDYTKSRLYGIKSKMHLSKLLGIEIHKLKDITTHFDAPSFTKKKNGKIRTLYNPDPRYKLILKKMNTLLMQITPPVYILGGIKNRNYAMNAAVHKDNHFFMNIDIQNFFPSTKDYFVYGFFRNSLKMSEDVAKICTLLTTVKNSNFPHERFLPQGFPTSPILSYLSYFEMYSRIHEIAKKMGFSFSCYYDDLAFSSDKFIHKNVKYQIEHVLNEYDLSIHPKKSKVMKLGNGIKITGAIIRKEKLAAPNKLQKKMHESFSELIKLIEAGKTNNKELLDLCNKVQGYISAVKTVEKSRKLPYYTKEIKRIRETLNK